MIVELLPDGRELIEHDDGRIEVRGASARPAERARAGYPPRRRKRSPGGGEAVDGSDAATTGLDVLLDADQAADFERRGRFWVPTPQGPVELGGPADALRHHPDDFPDEEWVLDATDPTEPTGGGAGDSRRDEARASGGGDGGGDGDSDADWSSLLLLVRLDPERFFTRASVAEVRRRPR